MKKISIDEIGHLANGNIGATNFLLELLFQDLGNINAVHDRLVRCEMRGTQLYVLYSDICGKKMDQVVRLCKSDCPDDLLYKACKQQDYSGVEILKDYL